MRKRENRTNEIVIKLIIKLIDLAQTKDFAIRKHLLEIDTKIGYSKIERKIKTENFFAISPILLVFNLISFHHISEEMIFPLHNIFYKFTFFNQILLEESQLALSHTNR